MTVFSCYFTMGVEDGEFTTEGGGTPACLSAEQATGIGRLLAAAAG